MGWTQKQIIIAVVMVIAGSLNTLSTKFADQQEINYEDGSKRKFDHPFLQACSMFLGEAMCLIAFKLYAFYKRRKSGELEDVLPLLNGNSDFSAWIFFPPALCDMVATSLMYIGLNLTYPSSFQMLRGAVIVFTGLLSVAFLQKTLKLTQWLGISFILCGLSIVGCSDFIFGSGNSTGINKVITGDLLIIMAQIISASQMVYEEKFINKYNVPALQAVGWEGVFGFLTLGSLLIPMYFIPSGEPFSNNPRNVLEDALDGFDQLQRSNLLLMAFIGTILSIAFFNFAGVSVTKELSATTRMVLDSVRTLVIWVVSLAVQWQAFSYVQLIGFVTLIIGMCVYNNIIIVPTLEKWGLLPARRPRTADIHPPSAVFAPPQSQPADVID